MTVLRGSGVKNRKGEALQGWECSGDSAIIGSFDMLKILTGVPEVWLCRQQHWQALGVPAGTPVSSINVSLLCGIVVLHQPEPSSVEPQ